MVVFVLFSVSFLTIPDSLPVCLQLSTEFTFFVVFVYSNLTFWGYLWVIIASSEADAYVNLEACLPFCLTLCLCMLNFISRFTSQPLPIEKSCMFSQLILIFSVLSSICGHLLPDCIEKHRSQNGLLWKSSGYSIHCKSWPSRPTIIVSFHQWFFHGRTLALIAVRLNFFKRLWGMAFWNSVGCQPTFSSGHFFT